MNKPTMTDSLTHRAAELGGEVLEKSKWALFFAPIIVFIERYIFSDWEFLVFLVVFMVLDTGLGFGYAFWKRKISTGKLANILVKIVVYGSVLVVGHVIENFEVSGETIPGGVYFKMTIYTAVMIVEGISILRNLGKINKKFVPLFLLKRLEGFNETGDFNDLTGNPQRPDPDPQSTGGDYFMPSPNQDPTQEEGGEHYG